MASEDDNALLRPTKLPIELIDRIIGFLKECTEGEQGYRGSVDACSLVCWAWNELCRPRIFSVLAMRMGSDETKPKVSFLRFTAPHLCKYIKELTILFEPDFCSELEDWVADALPQLVNARCLCILDTARSAGPKLLALGLPALLADAPIQQIHACNLHFTTNDFHRLLSPFSSTLQDLFLWECTVSNGSTTATPTHSEGPQITCLAALRKLQIKPPTNAVPRLPSKSLEVPRLSSLLCIYGEHFYDLSQWNIANVSELTLRVRQNSDLLRFSPSLQPSALMIIIRQAEQQWVYTPVIRWIGNLLSRFSRLDDLVDLKISIGNAEYHPTWVYYPSYSECKELRTALRLLYNGGTQRHILINFDIRGSGRSRESPADTGEVTTRTLREVFAPLIESGKDVTIDGPVD